MTFGWKFFSKLHQHQLSTFYPRWRWKVKNISPVGSEPFRFLVPTRTRGFKIGAEAAVSNIWEAFWLFICTAQTLQHVSFLQNLTIYIWVDLRKLFQFKVDSQNSFLSKLTSDQLMIRICSSRERRVRIQGPVRVFAGSYLGLVLFQ